MRKPQSQPKLASLSQADREQLADWLRHGEYDEVLERVNKSRPEGFGLNISKSPLQTFHAKVALLDAINSRLSDTKKISLALFESLATRDIYFLTSAHGENDKTLEQAHQSILNAGADLATSGDNTPAKLLSLQRLIDFPARVAIREQCAAIRANKEDRDTAKEHRANEMHAHRLDMGEFQKHIATERLELHQRALALREKQHENRCTNSKLRTQNSKLPEQSSRSPYPPGEDEFGPLLKGWDDHEGLSRRVRKVFNISDEEAARRKAIREAHKQRELAQSAESATTDNPAPTTNDDLPQSLDPNLNPTLPPPSASQLGSDNALNSSYVATEPSPHATVSPLAPDVDTLPPIAAQEIAPSPSSVLSVPPSSVPSVSLPSDLSSADLSATVHAYTIRRAEEYWAHRRTYSDPPPAYKSHPEYITQHRHCPCGAATPCPVHENEDTYGGFPDAFWKLSPHSVDYPECLLARDLPYSEPKGFL